MADRESLINIICGSYALKCGEYPTGDCEGCRDLVSHLIDNGVVVRDRGEWLTDEDDVRYGSRIKRKYCSACGKSPYFDRETGKYILTDFCHNCGADMR